MKILEVTNELISLEGVPDELFNVCFVGIPLAPIFSVVGKQVMGVM